MNQGLVKLVILIIIGAIVLGYFGINLRSIIESGPVQDNLGYLWGGVKLLWNDYLKKPFTFAYNIFYEYLWKAFIASMERLKGGQDPEFIENAPTF
ncbi:MAG: hypothetical protein COT67_01220 [Candidatus Tagabacteria bacterium CG09_land_8_20_14_0_10_41_14]|uniref:Uncharacterized protein n=2 Tax=Candidatus Tagaibacteriota TaxID=1817918 RepID=A0A2H0WLK0_9BACT|nr:MAG: hypothetical protein COT67_01220 [Candidatus Tagabacteria bacterium CG09_land_8_20_14_0_10_41_14]PJE73171.1 MAG: hypothetical protein COV00_01185 [Candidatus Tagabacteria bacterium CG10_big_fil_rev_8_21_14_0_10_40_13]